MKKVLKRLACGACSFLLLSCCSLISAKSLTLALDPGHGGPRPGCVYSYDGKTICERELNLEIAKHLKNALQKYKTKKGEKVVVHLTRNDNNTELGLEERVVIAKSKKADSLISLHNNATLNKETRGCMVLVTHSNYNNLYKKEHDLAKSIIKELNNIGIKTAKIPNATGKNAGLLRKLSDDGSKYGNGDTTDWYGIIMHGINHKIPSILVEHAYLSNEKDYRNFFSSDEKLKKLAEADARGIAKYYKLKLENIVKKGPQKAKKDSKKKTAKLKSSKNKTKVNKKAIPPQVISKKEITKEK